MEEQSSLEEGSYQTLQTVSGTTGHEQYEESDQKVERLRRLVGDFELEARNRRQRRNQDNRERRDDNVGDRDDGESNQSGSRQRQDCSRESRRCRTRSHSRGPHRRRNCPALGNHADEVILIPKNRVDEETVHIRMGMLAEVCTLPRIKGLTTQLWML